MFTRFCLFVLILLTAVGCKPTIDPYAPYKRSFTLEEGDEQLIKRTIVLYFLSPMEEGKVIMPGEEVVSQLLADAHITRHDGIIIEDFSLGEVGEGRVSWSDNLKHYSGSGYHIPFSLKVRRDSTTSDPREEYEIWINFPVAKEYFDSLSSQEADGSLNLEGVIFPFVQSGQSGQGYLQTEGVLSSHRVAIIRFKD